MRVVCRPELAVGFELAGMSVEGCDEASAPEVVKQLAAMPTVGVVLIEKRLHRSLPDDLRKTIDRRAWPLLVEFPSPSWEEATAAEEYVLELLRQAVGYRVRPR